MSYCIVFEKTGDCIPFEPIHKDLAEYYVEQCKQNDVEFYLPPRLVKLRLDLHHSIQVTNLWFENIFEEYADKDLMDQQVLNGLHADWALAHNSDVVTHNMKSVHMEDYRNINERIHDIELHFKKMIAKGNSNGEFVEFDNPFGESILTNAGFNISIRPMLLGRTLYDKYINYDLGNTYPDENNFEVLPASIDISLNRPEPMYFTDDYIRWCDRQNRAATNWRAPLGLIPNLIDKQTEYRNIIYRNVMDMNKFKLEEDNE